MTDEKTEEIIKELFSGIWRPASVEEEPVTELTEWSIRLLSANIDGGGDTVHIVGHALCEGRVSSPIQHIDWETRRATSKSGRIYELIGPPRHHPDAEYVWLWYVRRNGGARWQDITTKWMEKMNP